MNSNGMDQVVASDVDEMGRLIDNNAFAELIGVHKQTPNRWRHEGRGPKYVKLSARHVLYRMSDIHEWLSNRVVDPTT